MLRSKQEQHVEALQITISNLQLQVVQLQKILFSGKQEKFIAKPSTPPLQIDMFPNDKLAEAVVEKETHVPAHTKKKIAVRLNHQGRHALPPHLRREKFELAPQEDITGLQAVGEEVTEVLEYQQAELYVKQIVRKEYIKPMADGTGAKRIIASLPNNGFAKCKAGTSLLSYITISKYVDHLPIYRIQQIFKRDKIILDDATIYGWLKRVCELLEPLYELHKKHVLSTRYLSADETTIQVLDEEKKGGTHQGYFWAYYDTAHKLVLFEYQKGRAARYPIELLQNYQGYLLSDGYEGYSQFDNNSNITTHNCWVHARRKFIDAQQYDKEKCETVLTLIAQLYQVEKENKDAGVNALQQARQEKATPTLQKIQELLQAYELATIPGTPLHKAIDYTLKRWSKLTLYTTDGNLQIDNNLIENSIRPIAIGRKNYLFVGSHEAAQRTAMFYSLLYTCKQHNVNPAKWLQYALDNIYETKMNSLHQLLPQNYIAQST